MPSRWQMLLRTPWETIPTLAFRPSSPRAPPSASSMAGKAARTQYPIYPELCSEPSCGRRLDVFYAGLEAKIGAPDPNVMAAMIREHTKSDDSNDKFISGNYGIKTTPAIEWHFVYEPDWRGPEGSWPPEGNWPTETWGDPKDDSSLRRKTISHKLLRDRIDEINERLEKADLKDRLLEEEAIGGRLYTGPMVRRHAPLLDIIAIRHASRAVPQVQCAPPSLSARRHQGLQGKRMCVYPDYASPNPSPTPFAPAVQTSQRCT